MLPTSQFGQIAWVVDDLDAAVRHWQQTTGIGPFFVGAHIGGMITDGTYRGRPTEVDISAAIAQAGPVQIELIQQHGRAPSPYRDVYAEGESGIHHMQAFVEDVEDRCRIYREHGFEVGRICALSMISLIPILFLLFLLNRLGWESVRPGG